MSSQIILLRFAAFLIDAILFGLILVLAATAASVLVVWLHTDVDALVMVWRIAVALLGVAMLLRDGFGGQSPGKRLLGLQLRTPSGAPCGFARSAVRNLPILVPLWNVVELGMVLFSSTGVRSGDHLAGTSVAEE